MSEALILFGHGARDPRWRATLDALAQQIERRSPGTVVQPAFLEFMEPDLAQAVEHLVDAGHRALVVMPMFLAEGGHVLRDLPQQLAAIQAKHPGLSIRVEPALGRHPEVLDAMARVCLAACASAGTDSNPV